MNSLGSATWLWIGFSLFIILMLSLDLGLFNRKAHTIKYREAVTWTSVWVTLAVIFLELGGVCGGGVCGATTLVSPPLNPPANDKPLLDEFPYLAEPHAP